MSNNREIPIACRANNFNYTNPQTWQELVFRAVGSGLIEGVDALNLADRLALLMHARLWNNGKLGYISPVDGLCEGTLTEAFEAYAQASKRHTEEVIAMKKHAADLEAAKAAALAAVPAVTPEANNNVIPLVEGVEVTNNGAHINAEPATQPVTPT